MVPEEPLKLECFVIGEAPYDLRPAHHRRAWMNDTPEAFAYRCLPLSIANSHGWVMCSTSSFEAVWKGGADKRDLEIYPDSDQEDGIVGTSHFGSGVLTIPNRVILRTPPGYSLWVMGPPNAPKDGIMALSAVVETDWLPFPFTMNWKFTRPNARVRFEKGEPYCFFFPFKRGTIERFDPEVKSIESDAELDRQYNIGHNKRVFEEVVRHTKQAEGREVVILNQHALHHQRWYMKGQMPDGLAGPQDHQSKVRLKPFSDIRNENPDES